MKVLVTGANGFLGSWLARALVNDGHQVYALVRGKSDLGELQGLNCQMVIGDVTKIETLLDAAKGMDAIFHLAGVIAYKKSDRALMEKVNVEGTRNIVEVCREYKIPRLVYLSSVVAVGAGFTANEILNEESSYNIAHLDLGYFQTKHAAEEIVINACQRKQINAVILNPSTIYGAGDAKKGSRGTQLKVAQGRFKFYTSGGVNVVAVEDVIHGILSAWKLGKSGERYILSGDNLTIKELFSLIAQEAGVPAPSRRLPDWVLHCLGIAGDLLSAMGFKFPLSRENAWTATLFHWFDSSKAQRELGFKPRPAQEAIRSSVGWMKKQGLLEK